MKLDKILPEIQIQKARTKLWKDQKNERRIEKDGKRTFVTKVEKKKKKREGLDDWANERRYIVGARGKDADYMVDNEPSIIYAHHGP